MLDLALRPLEGSAESYATFDYKSQAVRGFGGTKIIIQANYANLVRLSCEV